MNFLTQFKEWRQKRADRQNAKELLAILKHIDANLHRVPDSGICVIVGHCSMTNELYRNYKRMMADVWIHWSGYSGSRAFPVSDPESNDFMLNRAALSAYYSKPRWQGPYGERRIELLRFLIRYFEKRV